MTIEQRAREAAEKALLVKYIGDPCRRVPEVAAALVEFAAEAVRVERERVLWLLDAWWSQDDSTKPVTITQIRDAIATGRASLDGGCHCGAGSPGSYEGPLRDCPVHGKE